MITIYDIYRTEDELHQSIVGDSVKFDAGTDIMLEPIYEAMADILKALYVIFGAYAAYYVGLLWVFIIGLMVDMPK